jgi:hypothetical protein
MKGPVRSVTVAELAACTCRPPLCDTSGNGVVDLTCLADDDKHIVIWHGSDVIDETFSDAVDSLNGISLVLKH